MLRRCGDDAVLWHVEGRLEGEGEWGIRENDGEQVEPPTERLRRSTMRKKIKSGEETTEMKSVYACVCVCVCVYCVCL